MSDDSQPESWSSNPNAPQISYGLYVLEKSNFDGDLVSAVFYGIIVVLFFQCTIALLNPQNRFKPGIKWGLLAYTTIMFSSATVYNAITPHLLSLSYIDARDFSSDELPSGPFGYQDIVYSERIGTVVGVMPLLTQWLADGLLLYRCFVIYAMNYWVMAFPCLVYLTTVATGIALLYYEAHQLDGVYYATYITNTSYSTISVSINVILTLMIVVRLALHNKKFRNAVGAPAASTSAGLYNVVITMLVESCAIYALNFLIYIGLWARNSPLTFVFSGILAETQVIAPLLIVLRVANRRALTKGGAVSKNIGSMRFVAPGSELADGSGTLTEEYATGSTSVNRETLSRLDGGSEGVEEEIPLRSLDSP